MGASVVAFEVRRGSSWVPIMRPTPRPLPQKSSNYSSFILAPYSNRIKAARFEFEGYTHQLEPNTPEGNAQHGDVRGRPWQVFHGASSAACTFDSRFFEDVNWPWPFSLAVLYRLEGNTLETTLELVNQGQSPMPAGFGLHPYFVRDLGEAVLQFEARGYYQTDAGFIPNQGMQTIPDELDFSKAGLVGKQLLNHVYGGWDGRSVLEWAGSHLQLLLETLVSGRTSPDIYPSATSPSRVRSGRLEADPVFEHLVVFTAPDGTLALEPVTNATDGFNLYARGIQGTGVRVLQPEENLAGKVRMTIVEQ